MDWAADADAAAPVPTSDAYDWAFVWAADADAVAPTPIFVIFVCSEPVADCKEAVAWPKLVTLFSNDAVACPKLVTLLSREPVADCSEAVASPKLETLPCREPVSWFNEASWFAITPLVILIAPSTVKVLPSQTNLSPKLNLLPLST